MLTRSICLADFFGFQPNCHTSRESSEKGIGYIFSSLIFILFQPFGTLSHPRTGAATGAGSRAKRSNSSRRTLGPGSPSLTSPWPRPSLGCPPRLRRRANTRSADSRRWDTRLNSERPWLNSVFYQIKRQQGGCFTRPISAMLRQGCGKEGCGKEGCGKEGCGKAAARLRQGRLRQGCGKAAARLRQGRLRQGCGKAAARLRQGCGKAAARLRQGCGKAARFTCIVIEVYVNTLCSRKERFFGNIAESHYKPQTFRFLWKHCWKPLQATDV